MKTQTTSRKALSAFCGSPLIRYWNNRMTKLSRQMLKMQTVTKALNSDVFALILYAACAVAGVSQAQADLLVIRGTPGNVQRYSDTGQSLGVFGDASGPGSGLTSPTGMAIGPDGNLYVGSSSSGDHRILRYDGQTGAFLGVFVSAGSGGLNGPRDLVFRPDGNLYVGSRFDNSIKRYNATTGAWMGPFIVSGSGGLNGAGMFTFGPDGNIYASSAANHQILRYHGSTGAFIDAFVPAGSGGLNGPLGLAFGPDGNLYVNSANTGKVLRYNGSSAAPMTPYVSTGLVGPIGLLFGPDNTLYISSGDMDSVVHFGWPNANPLGVFGGADLPGSGLLDPTYMVFTPPAITCPADIAPTGGNGAVNIDDLIELLSNFGSCP